MISGLQNPLSSPIGTPTTLGATATAPAPKPTTNTLAPSQTNTPSQTDLSNIYANVGGTIYNKQTHTKFSNPTDFFKDSGQTSFNNLKFDTNYTPTGSETIYGQPAPTPQASTSSTSNPNSGLLPTLAATQPATQPVTSTPPTTSTPASTPANSYYTPPNQGTTGVSQGGLIGNLNTNALSNPLYLQALAKVNDLSAKSSAIADAGAKSSADLDSEPIDLSLASGQKGILQNLIAAKQAALAPQYNAAIAELQGANTAQSNTTSGLSAAGSLNQPIQAGAYMSPSGNTTTGSTTSGAVNLNSLIGQRVGADGKTTEFYDTSTAGQGFPTPQALADFINKQQPGANVNASNVFQYLQQNGNQGVSGGGGALNPLNTVSQTAQAVVNGTMSYQDALAAGGNVANYTNLLQSAIRGISPGFNFNTAIGNAQAQQATTAQQQTLQAQYTSAKQQANNLSLQFTDLLGKYGLNPSEFNAANGVIQQIAANTSDARYAALKNYVTDIQNTYAAILGAGGTITNDVRDTAKGMLDSLASGQSLQSVIDVLDQQAQAKIAGVATPPNTNTGNTQTNNQTLGLF